MKKIPRDISVSSITMESLQEIKHRWILPVKDKSLADLDNLPDPDELAEIVENWEQGWKISGNN